MGNFSLIEGATLRGATLAYKAWGKLSGSKDNLIVYPTMYGGTHVDEDWMIGPGKALDTTKYFILVINMLGNGISSSPSNFPLPYNKARFPKIRYQDMVRAHHKLVTERFECSKVQLVLGGSMGAGQAFQWAVSYPEMVERIAPWCGNAKCAPHNFVFLEGIKAAMTADVAFKGGWYEEKPAVGLRAMARVWAGWGMSQQFYWQEAWREMGFSSLEDFIVGAYEGSFLQGDPNDYLSMLWTWQHADIGLTEGLGGDYVTALESIKAKAVVMPGGKRLIARQVGGTRNGD